MINNKFTIIILAHFLLISCKQIQFIEYNKLLSNDYLSDLRGNISEIESKEYYLSKDTVIISKKFIYSKNKLTKSIEKISYLENAINEYNYFYDKKNRLTKVTCQNLPYLLNEYNKNNKLEKKVFYEQGEISIIKNYEFDSKANIKKIINSSIKNTKNWIELIDNFYDIYSSEVYTFHENDTKSNFSFRYYYDSKGSIFLSEKIDNNSKEMVSKIKFKYDKFGNLIEQIYLNSKNEIYKIFINKYSYDKLGNVIRKEKYENEKLFHYSIFNIKYK